VSYRGYLSTLDAIMRLRMGSRAMRFDARQGTWRAADREIRASETNGNGIRFQLYTLAARETRAGSYSGTVGARPDDLARYLVYFLQTGKPWHQGIAGPPEHF
jgi:hypothetical protein